MDIEPQASNAETAKDVMRRSLIIPKNPKSDWTIPLPMVSRLLWHQELPFTIQGLVLAPF
jgi:hypothetical protein